MQPHAAHIPDVIVIAVAHKGPKVALMRPSQTRPLVEVLQT